MRDFIQQFKLHVYYPNMGYSMEIFETIFTKLHRSYEITSKPRSFKILCNNIAGLPVIILSSDLNDLPNIIGIISEKMESLFTISPSIDYLERAYDDAKYGHFS